MVASCWPLVGNVEYESPPKYRSYGPDEDDHLGPEQRAAKRRRIEGLANDYLKGKELYISSAVLKGTFDSSCVNPWRRKRREGHGHEEVVEEQGAVEKQRKGHELYGEMKKGRLLEPLANPTIVDTWDNTRMERPSSRASAGYCAEWLQRQKPCSRTPTIDSDDETNRPRRRGSITTTKSPTQRALSRKLARNSSPARAPRKDRSSPYRPHSPSIEHRRTRVTTIDHDLSVMSRLPESIDVTAGSSTLQHLPLAKSQTLGNSGSPENRTITTKLLERVAMPPPRYTGFTAINSPEKGGTMQDSTRKDYERQSEAEKTRKSHPEVLRSAEKIARRTASLGAKGPIVAAPDSRHPLVASPAVANGSPGFPYRRASDGHRPIVPVPISRESIAEAQSRVKQSRAREGRVAKSKVAESRVNESRIERTRFKENNITKSRFQQSRVVDAETDSVLGDDDPLDDMELDDAAPRGQQDLDADEIQSRSSSENVDIEEVRIVEPSAEDVLLNGVMAKWTCPLPTCTRDFTTRGGLSSHITKGHKLKVAKDKPAGKTKRKAASKSAKPTTRAPRRHKVVEDNADETGSVYQPSREAAKVTKAKQPLIPSPAHQLPALDFEMADQSGGAEIVPLPPIDTSASPKAGTETEIVPQNAEVDEVIPDGSGRREPDDIVIEAAVDDPTPSLAQPSKGSGETSAKDMPSTVESGPVIPDRQDSRAYSTFTFNPEQSTQAALLQAQLAFQETQANDHDSDIDELNAAPLPPPRETVSLAAVSKSANPLGAVTPFRELNNRFSAPTVPTPVFPVLPAATQDLEAAAAGVMFSTVKKPRTAKRISFENWPTTKPYKGYVAKELSKAIEWSPFASETPAPRRPFAASENPIFNPDETEIGRSESLPHGYEEQEITVLEAAPSSFAKTPHAKSFAARTPGSFSARPMHLQMSSAMEGMSRGSQGPSAPSDVPVPSFQEGQGLLRELNSGDVDRVLDESEMFLGSWDYEKGGREVVTPAAAAAVV